MFKSLWNWITCKDCIDCNEDKDDGVLHLNIYPAIPLPKTGPVTVTPSDSGAGGKFSITVSGCEGQTFTYEPAIKTYDFKVGDVYELIEVTHIIRLPHKFVITAVMGSYFQNISTDGVSDTIGFVRWETERTAYNLISRNQRVIVGVEND